MTPTPQATLIDVRAIAPRERHARIFDTYRELGAGQTMELVNDHDPQPLYHQFQAQTPGRFGWDYLQSGPAVWRVLITKVSAPHGQGSCCGACGGG
ncbi:MAG: DUF2249 domain-containing protein [Burkholderiales bacterium]|nr:DUF2249 domain-containing protein [Burkholderiales bacterium]